MTLPFAGRWSNMRWRARGPRAEPETGTAATCMIDNDAAGLVDTNVVVYLHDEGEPVKRERAIEVFSDLEYELVVSSQVMSEFYVATTRKLKRPVLPADATTTIALLAQLTVVPIGSELVQAAISLSQQHQLSYWDAFIVASARTGVVSSC